MIQGIDVCPSIQTQVDFKKVKQSGFDFVYIKCGQYSNTPEWKCYDYTMKALEAGLNVGHYWYTSARPENSPEDQAKRFFEYSSLHGTWAVGQREGENPPMIDWEFCKPDLSSAHCVDWISRMAKKTLELWYELWNLKNPKVIRKPTIYTYPWYASSHQPELGNSDLGDYPFTFAAYKATWDPIKKAQTLLPWFPTLDDSGEPIGPSELGHLYDTPKPWQKVTMWQYSGNNGLPVPGVIGSCDRDLFLGSRAEYDLFRGIYRPVDSIEGEVKE